AVRIQRREHAVDGGVFDLALVALRDEVVADEREHLAHLQGDLPDGIDVAVIEVARRVPDGDAHLALGEIRVRVTAVRGRTRWRATDTLQPGRRRGGARTSFALGLCPGRRGGE